MLCAVDNFPLVLARFPVKPGMTTDRTPPVIPTERSEWRDLHPTRPKKHVPHSPQDAHHTVRQFFERFAVGRCRKCCITVPKRDRPSCFSPI